MNGIFGDGCRSDETDSWLVGASRDLDEPDEDVTRLIDVAGLRIGLIARYRDDLLALSNEVRDVAEAVLSATLGDWSSAAARQAITVRWQDVYTRLT